MICNKCGMGYDYKEHGADCPNCKEIEKRDEGKPKCPACGAGNQHLEYVATITEVASVEEISGDDVIAGDVHESYDSKFHHINCSQCGKLWESKEEFAKAYRKKYGSENDCEKKTEEETPAEDARESL